MEYKVLGNTNIKVSEIGFGVLTIGNTQLDLPLKEGAAVISYAIERGINFFDTAQYYRTYPYIREAIVNSPNKDDIVICSKCLDYTYKDMERAIEEARLSLDRDVIDIFLLHEVRNGTDLDDRASAWECLMDYKEKGIIKAAGLSTHHVDVADRAAGIPEMDVIFPLINYASLGIRNGDGPGTCEDMAKAIKKASDNGKGVFTMKAFGGGNLTPHYQKALNYVRNLPGVDSMMIGFGSNKEVDDIFDFVEGRMPEDYNPDTASKRILIDQGDCEGCGTCIERCTSKAISFNTNGLAEVNSDICVTCGYCAPVCPVRAIILL